WEQALFVAVRTVDKAHVRYQTPKIAKTFLVVVSSAIVYQNIAFSHSLALCSACDVRQVPTEPFLLQQYVGRRHQHTRLRGSPLHLIRRSYSACVPIQTQIKPSPSSAASAR